MAYNIHKALPQHWSQNRKTLELILLAAGYKLHGNGIEFGYYKNGHGYWFCDDGDVEYSDQIFDWNL